MASLDADSVGQVFEYLRGAQSPQPEIQKAAESALMNMESFVGFCSCLTEIIKNKQADYGARWLAVIYLKNTIGKYWKTRPGQRGIVDEEKSYLRQALLQLIDQENTQLAVPIALSFAKIARADYPRFWPSLFHDLMELMNSGSTLMVRRVYLVLHHIVKELASMRLPADRENFAEVTRLLYELYWNQWGRDTHILLQELGAALRAPSQQHTTLLVVFERWFLLLKGLRRMVVYSSQSDARSLQSVPAVATVAPACLQTLQTFYAIRTAESHTRDQLYAMLDRALVKLAHTLKNILDQHPWSYYYSSGCFKPSIDFFLQVLTAAPSGDPNHDRFVQQSMLFMHTLMTCKAYRGIPDILQMGSAAEAVGNQTVQLSVSVAKDLSEYWDAKSAILCEALIRMHLPLTNKELQDWADNPEEFHQQGGIGSWEDSLRTCAETLLMTLLGSKRDLLGPRLSEMLNSACAECPPGSASNLPGPMRGGFPDRLLEKEAIYNAIGSCSWELLDVIDFPGLLRSTLLLEMGDPSPINKPLRRRGCILIGQFVAKLPLLDRPAVYRTLLAVLTDEDLAVALAGVGALYDLINDWEFVEATFSEFVEPCLRMLARLLLTADEYESQQQVFNVVNIIFDRLADSVKPFIGTILQLLPELWQRTGDQSLLRIQILLAIERVVNSLGPESPVTYPLLIPVLQFSTDPHQRDQLNILEDALELWMIALRNAPSLHMPLLDLFPNLVEALERSTEHIRSASHIMVSCILLGGYGFLGQQGRRLATILEKLIGNLNEKGFMLLMPVLDATLQTAPAEAPALLDPPLRKLFMTVVGSLDMNIGIGAATGIFARMLLQSPEAFVVFFNGLPYMSGRHPLDVFVEVWLDRFDHLSVLGSRKLSALGLCCLLVVPHDFVLTHLTGIFIHITATYLEVQQQHDDAAGTFDFTLYRPFEGGGDTSHSPAACSEEAEPEYTRRHSLCERDPVNCLELGSFFKEKYRLAESVRGPSFKSAVGRLDSMLKAQIDNLLLSAA